MQLLSNLPLKMKRRILLFHFLVFSTTGITAQVTISTRGGSHFFIGIDNAVTITSSKLDVKKLTLTVDEGTVTGADGFYTIRCSTPSANALIKVWNKRKVVAQKKMDVLQVSDPEAYVVGSKLFKSGSISKTALQKLYALDVKTNVPFLNITPIRFQYKRMRNNETLDILKNEGPMFSPGLKEMIRNAAAGDSILFDEIYCSGPDNAAMEIGPVTLTVTKK